MKRSVAAICILLGLLAGTWAHSRYIDRFTGSLISLLEEAQVYAEDSAWGRTAELTQIAFYKWQGHEAYLHILLRHSETDEVYVAFREVAGLLENREIGEYAAANARLITQLELLSEAEQLSLKNVL